MFEQCKTVKDLNNVRDICRFDGGKRLVYYTGKFDDYCIAVVLPGGRYDTPLDMEYFASLKKFGEVFGSIRTNQLFLRVYTLVSKEMSFPLKSHFPVIRKWTEEYVGEKTEYVEDVYEIMCILYAAMVSEENHRYKGKVFVGKDVKKTGVHLLLIDGYEPKKAADILRGMPWKEIKELSIKHNNKVKLPKRYWRFV